MGINGIATPLIMLDREGKARLLEEIEEIVNKINECKIERSNAIANEGAGSRLTENSGKVAAESEINRYVNRLKELKRILNNHVLVGPHNESGVDFGDIITLLECNETSKIRLVTYAPKCDDAVQEVTIESPLGKAIYGANIGDVCRLGNGYAVTILDIVKEVQLENNAPVAVKTGRAR